MLPRITPLAPTRIKAPFDDPDFLWQLKHDGFRALDYVEDGGCRLVSRKNVIYKSFAPLATALSGLKVKDAILDGEIVVLGPDGRSQFMELMRRRTQNALFYAFDLVGCEGVDLRPLPLLDRLAALAQVLKRSRVPSILAADHVQGLGTAFFKAVCERDCEGIVGKHVRGPYGAPNSWFKVLNPDYTQKRGRREMFDRFHGRQPGASR